MAADDTSSVGGITLKILALVARKDRSQIPWGKEATQSFPSRCSVPAWVLVFKIKSFYFSLKHPPELLKPCYIYNSRLGSAKLPLFCIFWGCWCPLNFFMMENSHTQKLGVQWAPMCHPRSNNHQLTAGPVLSAPWPAFLCLWKTDIWHWMTSKKRAL